MTGASDLLTHALAYAGKGWPVIPLHTPVEGGCSCRKKDCTSVGKHPRTMKGRDDASTDAVTIKRWWSQWPDANIGILTGTESGLISLDIDGPAGEAHIEARAIPATAEQTTGNGRQIIFKRHEGTVKISSRTGLFGPDSKIDIKADGGYIVAPPSLHYTGKNYIWELSSDPLDGQEPAPAPAWLLDIIKEAPEKKQTAAPVSGEIIEGQRNATLTSLAGTMQRRGMSEAAILAALTEENKRCVPLLPEAEIMSIVGSVSKYAPAPSPVTEPAKPGRRFSFVRAGEVEAKAPQWVVRGILEQEALALVFGDPGTAKSFWSMDVGLSVATGTPFHGHDVRPGPVIYIAGEGQNGIKRRLMAWSAARGVSHNTAPFYISLVPAALTEAEAVDALLAAIDDVVAEVGAPALVVVDTLARNFGAADESSTADMNRFVTGADAIRTKYRTTMLIVHHSGHADKTRARGAMALKAALDAEYRMDKDDTGTIRWEATKMKEAEDPEPMAFRLRSVDLDLVDPETGEIVTSAVLDPTSYEPRAAKGKQGRGKHQTRALEVLMDLWSARQTDDGEACRIGLAEWKTALKTEGSIPRKKIGEVANSLCAAGAVAENHGFISPVF